MSPYGVHYARFIYVGGTKYTTQGGEIENDEQSNAGEEYGIFSIGISARPISWLKDVSEVHGWLRPDICVDLTLRMELLGVWGLDLKFSG